MLQKQKKEEMNYQNKTKMSSKNSWKSWRRTRIAAKKQNEENKYQTIRFSRNKKRINGKKV